MENKVLFELKRWQACLIAKAYAHIGGGEDWSNMAMTHGPNLLIAARIVNGLSSEQTGRVGGRVEGPDASYVLSCFDVVIACSAVEMNDLRS